MTKLWLDDTRPAPEGWVHAKTVPEAIEVLRAGPVECASLDHDLGHCGYLPVELLPEGATEAPYRELTGMILCEWMAATNIWPKYVLLHTANSKARGDMAIFLSAHHPKT
jgi:hypothetical protein